MTSRVQATGYLKICIFCFEILGVCRWHPAVTKLKKKVKTCLRAQSVLNTPMKAVIYLNFSPAFTPFAFNVSKYIVTTVEKLE